MADQGGSPVIQLFCPACENVVWVEEADAEEVVFCPECGQSLHSSAKRKARPLSGPGDRSSPRPPRPAGAAGRPGEAAPGSHIVPAPDPVKAPGPFPPLPPEEPAVE